MWYLLSLPVINKKKMDKRWSLKGMTALVTGGASGIGLVFLLSSLYQNLASFLLLFNISLFFCR